MAKRNQKPDPNQKRLPQRSFEKAAFSFAAEWTGHFPDVSINGQRFAAAQAVAVRAESDEVPPPVIGYQLTLFTAAGQWRQLDFDLRGNVTCERLGGLDTPPTIAQSKEVF